MLPVDSRLADGSYLSHLHEVVNNKRRPAGVVVRVVEYGLDDPGRLEAEGTTYRLLTPVLDPAAAPAGELAALYPERWEFVMSSLAVSVLVVVSAGAGAGDRACLILVRHGGCRPRGARGVLTPRRRPAELPRGADGETALVLT